MNYKTMSAAALLLATQLTTPLARAELYSGTSEVEANRYIENSILSAANPGITQRWRG